MTNKEDFLIGHAHIKLFIDNYFDCLAMTNVKLDLAMGKHVFVPISMLKGSGSQKNYEDGEICLKPLRIVFIEKNKKGRNTKYLFQVFDVEKYTSSQYMNFLVRMNSCKKNNDGDKEDIRKTISWYDEIQRVIHQVSQMLMTQL